MQPPQTPKCGQRGTTRCALSWRSSTSVACSQLFLRRLDATRTSSPGSASSTKTTLPSPLWATPCASRSSDSIRKPFLGARHGSIIPALAVALLNCARQERASFARSRRRRRPRASAAVERSGNKDWQTLARKRSSLERGPPRAGPPKGQAAPFAALPISQVERTAGAVSRGSASSGGLETCSGAVPMADSAPDRRDAEDAAAFAARRARREDGAVRRLRHAGLVSRRHHGRASPVPRGGGAVRRLAHGPGPPRRRRRRGRARDAGAGRRRRPGRRQAALRALHQRRRRHPRRPDGDAPRRRPVPRRQRRLQGGRHRAPARDDRDALPHRADARPRAARAAGADRGRRHRRASHRHCRGSPS